MQHLVFWIVRQANVHTKREGKSVYETDLDPKLCRIAWTQMFGAFKAHLSEKNEISKGRHKYLFSQLDDVGQKLLNWLKMGKNNPIICLFIFNIN